MLSGGQFAPEGIESILPWAFFCLGVINIVNHEKNRAGSIDSILNPVSSKKSL
jgi:hypothetical protein